MAIRNNPLSSAKRFYFYCQTHFEREEEGKHKESIESSTTINNELLNIEMNTPPVLGSSLLIKMQKIPHHPMQIVTIFENEGTYIHQRLLGAILLIMLICFVVAFIDMLAYPEM